MSQSLLIYGDDCRYEWRDSRACFESDSDLFFESQFEDKAKDVCSKCEVRLECLDFAITTRQQEGIWGGLNPKERQRLRRRVA